jgi:hypothetical protein
MRNPFRYFNSSPEVTRLAVMMYIRYPLSLRQVEDLLFERGIDICHETVRFWWNRFGPMFAAGIRKLRPVQIAETEEEKTADKMDLDGEQFCYAKSVLGLSLEAQTKLRELVDARGLRSSAGGRVKWAKVGDILADIDREPRVRRLFGPATSVEIRERLGDQI